MNLTSRTLLTAAVTLAVAVGLGFAMPNAAMYLIIVGAVGALASIVAGACPLPKGMERLTTALAQASKGKPPAQLTGASPWVVGMFQQTEELANTIADMRQELQKHEKTIRVIRSALSDVAEGRELANRNLLDEAGVWQELLEVRQAIEAARKRQTSFDEKKDSVRQDIRALDAANVAVGQATGHIAQTLSHLRTLNETAGASLDQLATSAEESSTNLKDMMQVREKLQGEFENLVSHARETGTSIEEMAFSIQEVAKNVDALALTAEATSSSMNEMDVSIDQVQSNADETARLSEKVTRDAEQGGKAIMKTIEEINRIKESTAEAVEVIKNLGTRIEAISEILSVIDDVAEQTNLLALNAAIIAAQAGEHGKGFAVVADEIKDLADRAGTSTREIAELTRTIQAESKNAIDAVQRGAENVKRGVMVSNEAEHALKQILESSRKSTARVQTIARATQEQAKGSRQVTEAISTIARTVQQIATTTNEQAKSSEFVMRGVETIRQITDRIEQTELEQNQVTERLIETMSAMQEGVHGLRNHNTSLADFTTAITSAAEELRSQVGKQKVVIERLDHACLPSDS